MNSEFDRLVERAADPNLIPGIYNYCDGRCPRCPFNERCLSFLENRDLDAQQGPATNDEALAEALERSIQRTIEFLKETAKREGFDLSAALAAGPKASDDASDDPARHRRVEVVRETLDALAEAILHRMRRETPDLSATDEAVADRAANKPGRAGDENCQVHSLLMVPSASGTFV